MAWSLRTSGSSGCGIGVSLNERGYIHAGGLLYYGVWLGRPWSTV